MVRSAHDPGQEQNRRMMLAVASRQENGQWGAQEKGKEKNKRHTGSMKYWFHKSILHYLVVGKIHLSTQ